MSEYQRRDPAALDAMGGFYARHVRAMTEEGLHGKSDIAAELGWRDSEIESLRAQLAEARGLRLGRAPTAEEFRRQSVAGLGWMLQGAGEDNGGWAVEMRPIPEADIPAMVRFCRDAIPLDTNRQPCPVGGGRGTP